MTIRERENRARETASRVGHSGLKHLYDCYNNPSPAKCRIYSALVQEALEAGATWWGVTSFNSQVFSFGYFFDVPEVGECFRLVTVTTDTIVTL